MTIDEMKAGRELDALVAEKVMGWTRCASGYRAAQWNYVRGYPTGWPSPDCHIGLEPGKDTDNVFHQDWRTIPTYSTDIADAWEVVDRLYMLSDCDGEAITQIAVCKGHYGNRCEITCEHSAWIIEANTAPLAICLAALKAVGHTVDTNTEVQS